MVKQGKIEINAETCKGCGLCAVACSNNAITISNKSNAVGLFPAKTVLDYTCNACTSCAVICPDACIKVQAYQEN